jgi:acetoin utilization deacetylase AcuC-like enzyme
LQQVAHSFISVQKIPEFVRQADREPVEFLPYRTEDFETAHGPAFVKGVFSGTVKNGFGTMDPEINQALHYSNASMGAAAQYVLDHGGVACSASQGFHHAHYDNCYGYCTFNGLVIAARKALERVGQVLIIDGDAHHGDGTEDCLQRLSLQNRIINVSRRGLEKIGRPEHSHFSAAQWEQFTDNLIRRYSPGLVIYQAGADAWELDPYESGYLSMTGLKHRDEGVFKACKQAGVPVAWNLAGGYSDPMQLTIDIHLQTLAVSDQVFLATY